MCSAPAASALPVEQRGKNGLRGIHARHEIDDGHAERSSTRMPDKGSEEGAPWSNWLIRAVPLPTLRRDRRHAVALARECAP